MLASRAAVDPMPPNGVTIAGFATNARIDRGRAFRILEHMVADGEATTTHLNTRNARGQICRTKVYLIKG